MSVPITGGLLFFFCVGCFLFSRRLLYATAVFLTPFSAMALVNIGGAGSGKGVPATLFVWVLWALREACSSTPIWHRRGWFLTRASRHRLLAFGGAAVLSLSVPLLLNGTSWVQSGTPIGGSASVPLLFGPRNVTQTAYLAAGLVLALLVASVNCDTRGLRYTAKIYVASCVFVAGWGMFELWCLFTGHNYPSYLFNTSQTPSALGYTQALTFGAGRLGRISSVALEPSILAQELLLAFVILLTGVGLRRPLFSRRLDYAALGLIGVVLLASTSTTAYAGILIALLVAVAGLYRAGKPVKYYVVLAGAAIGAAVLVAASVPILAELAGAMIGNKLQAGSGAWRVQSIRVAAADFLARPVLGAGWHNVNCWDLVFLILANMGLVGLLAFAFFIVPVARRLWKSAPSSAEATMILSALVVALALSEGGGLVYAAGYIWLIFGLAAGAAAASCGGKVRLAGGLRS